MSVKSLSAHFEEEPVGLLDKSADPQTRGQRFESCHRQQFSLAGSGEIKCQIHPFANSHRANAGN